MTLTADTNVLVRFLVGDNVAQHLTATAVLKQADKIALPLPVLCELTWVLSSSYGYAREEIADAIRQLVETDGVVVDGKAVEAGLAVLEAGGDFTDGAIAYEGVKLGGHVFLSFDKQASRLLEAQGHAVQLLR